MATKRKKTSVKRPERRALLPLIPRNEILMLMHENSENAFRHYSYDEESRRFHLLMQGNPAAVDESVRVLNADLQGKLSTNPLRNLRYLFIVNTGLATRYAIEAGVPQELVYSTSDVYIQKADIAKTEKEICDLNREVWEVLVRMVQESRDVQTYSKPIMKCLDYIDAHFTTKITLSDLAKEADLHPVHVEVLFKKELGECFGAYLSRKRIDTAKALLTRTEYSYSQIAYSLAFCSQSHFIRIFREHTGITPRQYRMQFYNTNFSTLSSTKN